jgi:hypothetical protein
MTTTGSKSRRLPGLLSHYDPFKGLSHSMEQDYPTEKEVFERLKRDISLRLSDVCSELSEADRAAIVHRITRNQGRHREVRDP